MRFIVLDGRERERVELPLPLTLERGVDYRVRVSVRGGRFLTSVNGQLVSSWMDSRLSRGGVGFFSEDGESSLLKWVSVSERDSFLGPHCFAFLPDFLPHSRRSIVDVLRFRVGRPLSRGSPRKSVSATIFQMAVFMPRTAWS